jgi:hypothetical protein
MSSAQQIVANQLNAQHSTGPRTEQGKKRSSLNALKSGLTGRTVLLPGEDANAYQAHCEAFMEGFAPVGEEETALVQLLADTRWRLDRCSVLETNLFALGQVEFQDLFPEELPQVRQALIQAHTFRAYKCGNEFAETSSPRKPPENVKPGIAEFTTRISLNAVRRNSRLRSKGNR